MPSWEQGLDKEMGMRKHASVVVVVVVVVVVGMGGRFRWSIVITVYCGSW